MAQRPYKNRSERSLHHCSCDLILCNSCLQTLDVLGKQKPSSANATSGTRQEEDTGV